LKQAKQDILVSSVHIVYREVEIHNHIGFTYSSFFDRSYNINVPTKIRDNGKEEEKQSKIGINEKEGDSRPTEENSNFQDERDPTKQVRGFPNTFNLRNVIHGFAFFRLSHWLPSERILPWKGTYSPSAFFRVVLRFLHSNSTPCGLSLGFSLLCQLYFHEILSKFDQIVCILQR
jgi:hypothetical protein